MNMKRKDSHITEYLIIRGLIGATILFQCGCSTAQKRPVFDNGAQTEENQKVLKTLRERVETLDHKVNILNAEIDAMRLGLDLLAQNKGKHPTFITRSPLDIGTPIGTTTTRDDPEAGFVNDEAVQSFRKSVLL